MAAVDDNGPATDGESFGILPAAPGLFRASSPVVAIRHLTVWQDLDFALSRTAFSGRQRLSASRMRAPPGRPEALLPEGPVLRHDKNLRQEFSDFVFAEHKRMNIPPLMVTPDRADVLPDGKAVNFKKYMVLHV